MRLATEPRVAVDRPLLRGALHGIAFSAASEPASCLSRAIHALTTVALACQYVAVAFFVVRVG
jgi:hypothetical protein